MEKQRNTKRHRFVSGLLIILCLSTPVWAGTKITAAQIRELKIKPAANEKLITDREIKFELDIPTIEPGNVEITTPASTDEIVFKTLRRTSNGNGGTKIELWYEFLKNGERKPESLGVKISNRNYKIPFEYVWIELNPMKIQPRLIFKFSNGKSVANYNKDSSSALFSTPVSKPITISVLLQYTNQITSFNYEIPKDSLLQITKTYDIAENIGKKSNHDNLKSDYIPVVDFEWTPLSKGKTPIPKIKLTVVSIAGNQFEFAMPETFVNVTSNKTSKNADNLSAFKNQFDETEIEEMEEETPATDTFAEIAHKRKLCQKLIVVSLSLLSLFLLIAILVSAKIKKSQTAKKVFITAVTLAGVSIILLIISTVILKQPAAIYTGGQISSIPEATAGNHIQIMENSQVKIIKETSDWYCIQSGGNVGWTKKENIAWE